jgi:hypothetical protein
MDSNFGTNIPLGLTLLTLHVMTRMLSVVTYGCNVVDFKSEQIFDYEMSVIYPFVIKYLLNAFYNVLLQRRAGLSYTTPGTPSAVYPMDT